MTDPINLLDNVLSIISYIMCAGASLVRGQLPKLVVLWRNSFPHSVKDATVEQAKGNLQSWVVMLEGRAGSLSCKQLCIIYIINSVKLIIEQQPLWDHRNYITINMLTDSCE